MKALIFKGKNKIEWTETTEPVIVEPTDIIVKIEGFTFSHADYRPYLGQDDSVALNTIMGHEGVGIVTAVGGSVINLRVGDRVAIGCITHCNICQWCLRKAFAKCVNGGFILGTKINGTHAEYVRIPYGDNSVIKISSTIKLADALMLSDVLPTAYENVIKKVDFQNINNIAIIGDGPIGLAVLLLINKYHKEVDVYGHHSRKLDYFEKLGAHKGYDSTKTSLNIKYDLVIECVGHDRGTFEQAQQMVNFNGTIITIGVFNKSVVFNLQQLWYQNITVHTGILNVYTLDELVTKIEAKEISPMQLVTKAFNKNQVLQAYEAFMDKDIFKVVVKL
ncbi:MULTISPECIES: alcohol dehydrogenase catalytic domain-containing protein [Spiroplasma]|uniref:alcohol dehydrogenase catalytic domain-containing protein n=1 Tax=Spiroplasma TaxID=2132 RepID=UPI0018DB014F|nr:MULTISPECIES: alcohol dehydrogenase catalytic domain-containing protein [Spiroplasma]MBH8622463.1 alcohol dehydrogenase [Spiroplasma sp. hyd1]UNF61419.1 alcohol dehydrogenase catalytic domain-containing protein [Spiroplasma poulsonii]